MCINTIILPYTILHYNTVLFTFWFAMLDVEKTPEVEEVETCRLSLFMSMVETTGRLVAIKRLVDHYISVVTYLLGPHLALEGELLNLMHLISLLTTIKATH